ncbi:hypothetical protein [Reichenbachiella versicolor]|uniref:hypothetical protein n=1 Tax=Reichenbachiella versicolor TaxID=1821036 RepID=UPI000D6E23F5|nr:hypothetical protein [Reichenbachiella versicolor]
MKLKTLILAFAAVLTISFYSCDEDFDDSQLTGDVDSIFTATDSISGVTDSLSNVTDSLDSHLDSLATALDSINDIYGSTYIKSPLIFKIDGEFEDEESEESTIAFSSTKELIKLAGPKEYFLSMYEITDIDDVEGPRFSLESEVPVEETLEGVYGVTIALQGATSNTSFVGPPIGDVAFISAVIDTKETGAASVLYFSYDVYGIISLEEQKTAKMINVESTYYAESEEAPEDGPGDVIVSPLAIEEDEDFTFDFKTVALDVDNKTFKFEVSIVDNDNLDYETTYSLSYDGELVWGLDIDELRF